MVNMSKTPTSNSKKKINIGKTAPKQESTFDYIEAHKEIMDELKRQGELLIKLLKAQIDNPKSSYSQDWLKKFTK